MTPTFFPRRLFSDRVVKIILHGGGMRNDAVSESLHNDYILKYDV